MFINPYDHTKWFTSAPLDQRYHLVYITTNTINNKIYVGKHTTWILRDWYIGSGKALERAIKKYGKKYFKRNILYYCLSKEEAFNIESNIVDETFYNRHNVYNMSLGGKGGNLPKGTFTGEDNPFFGKTHTQESRDKIKKNKTHLVGIDHYRSYKILVTMKNGIQFSIIGLDNLCKSFNLSIRLIKKFINTNKPVSFSEGRSLNCLTQSGLNTLGWQFQRY